MKGDSQPLIKFFDGSNKRFIIPSVSNVVGIYNNYPHRVTDRKYDMVNVQVNISNLATMLGVSEKTIKRDISAMQSLGVIRHIGPTNGRHWDIIPEK